MSTPDDALRAEYRRLMSLPFRMTIREVFSAKDRRVVVSGVVETGILDEGDAVMITGDDIPIPTTVVMIIHESGRRMLTASIQSDIEIVLCNVEVNSIRSGMIITNEGLSDM